jgi:hypothetical protein
VLRIWGVYPGSDFSISDPGSRVDKIPDPESASKNYVFLTQKTDTKFSIMRSPDPVSGFFSIPDPKTRSLGQKSTRSQSGSATLFLQIFLKNFFKIYVQYVHQDPDPATQICTDPDPKP